MKHIFIFLSIFLSLETLVFAQENIQQIDSIPQKREEIKAHIEEKKSELTLLIEEKRIEIKNKLEQSENKTKLSILAQERILKITSHVFEQFDAVLVKFDGIVTRINARILKLNEQGVSTTVPSELLLQAQSKIATSTALITATRLELEEAIKTEVSKDQIKDSIELCKTSLKETQAALVDVIASLKSLDNLEEDLLLE